MANKPAKRSKDANGGAADKSLRKELASLLDGGNAHATFEQAIDGLPVKLRGVKPSNLPFTAWRLLEHLRIAQWDILEFSVNPKHISPKWPDEYWPKTDAPPSDAAWKKSVQQFRRDLKRIKSLIADLKTDLHARIPLGDGQTILREALLMADHNAYHIGELVLLRRLLGAWKK